MIKVISINRKLDELIKLFGPDKRQVIQVFCQGTIETCTMKEEQSLNIYVVYH